MSITASTGKFFGYRAAIGAFMIMVLSMGCGTTFGTFMSTLSAYTEWDVATIGYVGTISVVGNIIFSIAAARLVRTWGPKRLMIISFICTIVPMFLYAMVVPGHKIISLAFIYAAGFIVSISVTFGSFAVCTAFVSQWFVARRETMVGIVLSSAAFGSSFWNFLSGQLFRVMEFQSCYFVMIAIASVIGLTALIFFVKEPGKMGQKPLGWDTAETKTESASLEGVAKSTAVRSASFWLLFAAFICICGAGASFTTYAQTWWQQNGFDRTTTATYYAMYILIGGLSLVVAGKLISKIRAAAFTAIIGVLFIVGTVCQVLLPGNPTGMMVMLICIFCGLAYPLNVSMPGLVTQSIFGPRESGSIQATLQIGVYIGQFPSSIVVGQFLKSEAGFPGAWKFYVVMVAVWAVLIIASALLSPYKPGKKA